MWMMLEFFLVLWLWPPTSVRPDTHHVRADAPSLTLHGNTVPATYNYRKVSRSYDYCKF